jgi:phage terminase Nu1 subunit (DNA packaging protein)
LATAQAQAAEMKNAAFCGDLVSLSAIARIFERFLLVFRERCLNVPGSTADSLTPHCAEDRIAIELILRERMYEALEDLSDPEFMGKAVDEVAGRNRVRWSGADHHVADDEEPVA